MLAQKQRSQMLNFGTYNLPIERNGDGSYSGTETIKSFMNGPITEAANWELSTSLYSLLLVALIIFALILLAAFLVWRRRRKKKQNGDTPITPSEKSGK
jgi:LPXTG-motif cell wall-anchored protein